MVCAGLATPHFVRIVHSEGQMAFFFVILPAKLNFFVANIEKQFLVDLDFIKKTISYLPGYGTRKLNR
jgi:hypothetical protein